MQYIVHLESQSKWVLLMLLRNDVTLSCWYEHALSHYHIKQNSSVRTDSWSTVVNVGLLSISVAYRPDKIAQSTGGTNKTLIERADMT